MGPISPLNLSGGVKTLISIYKNPELIFDATSCGENCARWIIEIGKRIDVTINLNYLMRLKEFEPFDILIENDGELVRTNKEYVREAIKYV